MKEDFKEGIKASIMDTFQTMLSLDIEYKDEKILAEGENLTSDVSGIIGLAGNYVGSIAVHINKDVSMKITSAMLGMDITEFNDDVEDCVGELANLVAGGAKTQLAAKGMSFDICIPTVVVGDNHQTTSADPDNRVIMAFETNKEPLMIELTVKQG